MDQKVVEVGLVGVVAKVAMVTSPQLLDVVWCSAGVVVVADVVLLVAVAYYIVLSEALCCMM